MRFIVRVAKKSKSAGQFYKKHKLEWSLVPVFLVICFSLKNIGKWKMDGYSNLMLYSKKLKNSLSFYFCQTEILILLARQLNAVLWNLL